MGGEVGFLVVVLTTDDLERDTLFENDLCTERDTLFEMETRTERDPLFERDTWTERDTLFEIDIWTDRDTLTDFLPDPEPDSSPPPFFRLSPSPFPDLP